MLLHYTTECNGNYKLCFLVAKMIKLCAGLFNEIV